MNPCMLKGIPLLVRPLLSEPFFFSTSSITIFRRHESSYRRTRKRLVVKPDPSFLSSTTDSLPQQDHIVFNPPSSAPSIYHTPIKFLPKDDPRRVLFFNLRDEASQDASPLPPPVRKPYQKSYHLTEEDIAEIRRLRRKDPDTWTRNELAKKFKCSSLFVGMVCQATKERLAKQADALEAIKARWGRKRQMAREDRVKRRELWGRDEGVVS